MKRTKTLLILLAVLVVAIIAILVEKAVKQHIDTINTIDEEVFTITEDDLTSVNVVYGEDEITLEQADGTWTYTGDTDFPVDQDFVADMLSYFDSVHASFIIDDVEDYSQYGLESPQATITFTTADGDNEITFGDFSTIDEKRYICVNSGSVYLIDEDILEYVSASVEDFLDRDTVDDYSQVSNITVTGDGDINLVYDPDGNYTYTDDYDYYAIVDDEYLPLSESKIYTYVNSLSTMDLTEYKTYKATSDDLAEYGLDNPTLTVTITGDVPVETEEEDTESTESAENLESTEELTDTEAVEETEEDEDVEVETKTQTIYFSYEDDADTAYLYFEGSTIVYTITADEYETVSDATYESLRPSEIVSIDWTNVAQISTEIEGTTYVVSVEYDEDDGNTYKIDEDELDFVTSTSSIDGLTLSEVGDSYDKGTQELAFAITLNDDEATVVNVVIYQYDGDSCVVDVDGKTVGLISRSSMSTLREEMTSAILNKGKEATEEETAE